MKILSINFIKESEIPDRTRNTETAKYVSEIGERLKAAPAGQGLVIKVEGAQKWHRYSLQRRLQRAGHKALVSLTKDGNFLVRRAPAAAAKK